ncbi:TPA: hypothetical protein LU109_003600 [Enterobacter hormaechei subsp. xiangfangensis]|nr:hypothetical protein [Enterobacter hormaechei subsp. xiangfangensis]
MTKDRQGRKTSQNSQASEPMFSARVSREDVDYINQAAFYLKLNKQEILREAIALFREKHPLEEMK